MSEIFIRRPVMTTLVMLGLFLFGVVAYRGIREATWVTSVLVAVKVLVCLFVILAGAFYVRTSNWSPFVPAGKPPKAGASGLAQPIPQVAHAADGWTSAQRLTNNQIALFPDIVVDSQNVTHIVIGKDMKIVPMPQKYVDVFRNAAGKQ